MRILHTSDWHLGRNFGPVSLADHQHQFVDWLVDLVSREHVDLVVVAGDVYDRPIPPTAAIALFRQALRRLREAGALVAVITGNHDSADRVAAYDELLDGSGVFVRGGYGSVGEVLPLGFADGPLDVVMLPFLDPQAAPDHHPEPTDPVSADTAGIVADAFERRVRRTHHSVLRAAVEATAATRRAGVRSLAVAHAFVAGMQVSDSERQLTVGGQATVPAALFADFSYAALGHLHTPQEAGSATVRYSGTPLAYSFSETVAKSVTLVDLAPDGACRVEAVPVPVGRGVATITGTIDELLGRPPSPHEASSFVRAVLTDPGVVLDAKQRLSTVYPYVVEVVPRPPAPVDGSADEVRIDRRVHSPAEVAERFWLDTIGEPPSSAERALLHDVLADAVAGER